jgi:hypothetical protein
MKFEWIKKHFVVEDENFLPICVQYGLRQVDPSCTFHFTDVNFSLRMGKWVKIKTLFLVFVAHILQLNVKGDTRKLATPMLVCAQTCYHL